MNTFLKKIVKYFIISICAILSILIFSSLIVQKKAALRGRGSVIDKNRLLRTATSPKIVLIGGSNICYGINSALLQDSLKMQVVDMSVNARTGMLFYINQVKNHLKRGDIVICIPEYAAYNNTQILGDVNLYNLCTIELDNCKLLTTKQWLRLPQFTGEIISTNFNVLNSGNSEISRGRYSYNKFGDFEGHKDKEGVFKFSNDTSNLKGFVNNQNDAFELFLDFNNYCKQSGVQYLHSFPVFFRDYYHTDWEQTIKSNLPNVDFLNSPNEFLFGVDSLYDSENHLQFKYRDVRTERLIKNLKEYLKSKEAIK